jgi:hypothetical protein
VAATSIADRKSEKENRRPRGARGSHRFLLAARAHHAAAPRARVSMINKVDQGVVPIAQRQPRPPPRPSIAPAIAIAKVKKKIGDPRSPG